MKIIAVLCCIGGYVLFGLWYQSSAVNHSFHMDWELLYQVQYSIKPEWNGKVLYWQSAGVSDFGCEGHYQNDSLAVPMEFHVHQTYATFSLDRTAPLAKVRTIDPNQITRRKVLADDIPHHYQLIQTTDTLLGTRKVQHWICTSNDPKHTRDKKLATAHYFIDAADPMVCMLPHPVAQFLNVQHSAIPQGLLLRMDMYNSQKKWSHSYQLIHKRPISLDFQTTSK